MPHDHHDDDLDTATGVGTDGSLHSVHEGPHDHGADHSADRGAGVGTDGSLVDPEKEPDPDYRETE